MFPDGTQNTRLGVLRIVQLNASLCILCTVVSTAIALENYKPTAYISLGVFVLDVYLLLSLLSGYRLWKVEEIVDADLKKKTRCACCIQHARLHLPILTWLSARTTLWLLFSLAYGITLTLYVDFAASPTGHSSCTTDSVTEGKVYNARGVFSAQVPYTSTYIGKFCPQYQRYAYPTTRDVLTFAVLPTDKLKTCNGGVINTLGSSIVGYPALGTLCAFPDLSVGLQNPPQPGSKVLYCPSSKANRVYCKDPNQNPPCNPNSDLQGGLPETICPSCLYYAGRQQAPPGYEHCAKYSPSTPVSPFCSLCPDPYLELYTETLFAVHTTTYVLYSLSVFLTPLCIKSYGTGRIEIHKQSEKPKPN